jgi:CNT family concentrative nucleoside transporter
VVPGVAGHLIVASVISVPAALLLAELMVPNDPAKDLGSAFPGQPGDADMLIDDPPRSSMDAIAQGTWEGVTLLANVTAMLIVAVALVALANQLLGLAASPFGLQITFQQLLGRAFAPLAWLIGIPWAECGQAGALLGVKTVLNELLAYLQLAGLPSGALSERSRLILTYALCGFANFGSLGIMVGGIAAMVPQRRAEIASLGARTMVSGTLATLMTAAVVGAMTGQ